MDPQVKENKPGKCPICKMELTPVKKSGHSNQDEIALSAQQIRLGNIHTDTIRDGSVGEQLVLPATLNFDQASQTTISARIAGRVERLYFKNTGAYVAKGEKLYDLYSEELNNAKQEYLLLAEKQKKLGNAVVDFDQLIRGAKNKLLLWGMTEGQIQELAK
jgi:Cu(I)/Ag(I) efflux system membrane fusion protein